MSVGHGAMGAPASMVGGSALAGVGSDKDKEKPAMPVKQVGKSASDHLYFQGKHWEKIGGTLKSLRKMIEEKMQKSDAPPEYKISHVTHAADADGGDRIHVSVHHGAERVGHANFWVYHQSLVPDATAVHKDHRRKGLANAMYQHAEKVTGKRIERPDDDSQTNDAKAFWDQPNRKFGRNK